MQLLRGRTIGFDQLLISSDGRYVVAGTTLCHVWDLHDPKAKPRPIPTGGPGNWNLDVQFLNATQLFIRTAQPYTWSRYDFETGLTTDLKCPAAMSWHMACVHPSGETVKVLVQVQSSAHEARTYRVLSDRLELLDTPRPLTGRLSGFSPTGLHYLFRTQDSRDNCLTYALHDAGTDAVVTTFEPTPGNYLENPRTWCFSPDGWQLFVAGWELVRYDCSTGGSPTVAVDWRNNQHSDHPLAAHPDGRLIATVEDGRAVTFRDAETLEVIRTYDFAMPTVTCVAFTPDGTRCVIGNSRGKVLLFDVE